jgi:hypothetical protein
MPGANCSIFGCATSRKHVGVGIFKIHAGTDELSKKTRKAWISVITKDRSVDESLRRQINSGNLYVCERHFRKEEYECCKYTLFIYISISVRCLRSGPLESKTIVLCMQIYIFWLFQIFIVV